MGEERFDLVEGSGAERVGDDLGRGAASEVVEDPGAATASDVQVWGAGGDGEPADVLRDVASLPVPTAEQIAGAHGCLESEADDADVAVEHPQRPPSDVHLNAVVAVVDDVVTAGVADWLRR